MIAFAHGSEFPYFVYGRVINYMKDDRVVLDGIGKGIEFTPDFIVSDEKGKEIIAKLMELDENYEQSLVDLKKYYQQEAKNCVFSCVN